MNYPKNRMLWGQDSIAWTDLRHYFPVQDVSFIAREQVSDFKVIEQLGWNFSNDGCHTWLWIEKVNMSTNSARKNVAQFFGLPIRDIGYSGLKDFRAIAYQWLSLPWETKLNPPITINGGLKILDYFRHKKKCRVGVHKRNKFEIRLKGIFDKTSIKRLKKISTFGVPNYFGPQRFGKNGNNILSALKSSKTSISARRFFKMKNTILASAARSAGFNAVLNEHLNYYDLLHVESGDIVNLNATNSTFAVEHNDLEDVRQRVYCGDIHPTGPLAGLLKLTIGNQDRNEKKCLLKDPFLYPWLCSLFNKEERRPLRVIPEDLSWEFFDNGLEIRFSLNRGSFATSVIRELGITKLYGQ